MRHVVFDEKNFIERNAQPLVDDRLHPKLIPEPVDHRFAENFVTPRESLKNGEEDALEFQERLFVEDNIIKVVCRDPCFLKAKLSRKTRKSEVVLYAAEALLFCSRHQSAVFQKRRCRIVVETTDSEDIGHGLTLAARIFQRRFDGAASRETCFPVKIQWVAAQAEGNGHERKDQKIEQRTQHHRIEAGDALRNALPALPDFFEYVHRNKSAALKKGIDKRCQGTRLGEEHQSGEKQKDNDDGRNPPELIGPEENKKFT